jgi:hypothetical protein
MFNSVPGGWCTQLLRIQSYSNLNGCDDDDAYRMSKMSVNDHHDDYPYDSRTKQQGAKSVSFDPYSSGRSINSTASCIQGLVSSSSGGHHRTSYGGTPPRSPAKPFKAQPVSSCSLPYIIDYWHGDLVRRKEQAFK